LAQGIADDMSGMACKPTMRTPLRERARRVLAEKWDMRGPEKLLIR
jgi:hypothetical protein